MDRLEQYRIIQESAEHLVVELVCSGDPNDDALAELRSRFMEHLGGGRQGGHSTCGWDPVRDV